MQTKFKCSLFNVALYLQRKKLLKIFLFLNYGFLIMTFHMNQTLNKTQSEMMCTVEINEMK